VRAALVLMSVLSATGLATGPGIALMHMTDAEGESSLPPFEIGVPLLFGGSWENEYCYSPLFLFSTLLFRQHEMIAVLPPP